MNNRNIHSLISTAQKYNEQIEYFGDDTKFLRKINFVVFLSHLIDLAGLYELDRIRFEKLILMRNQIIQSDNRFVMMSFVDDKYSTNVNTQQNQYTWRKLNDIIKYLTDKNEFICEKVEVKDLFELNEFICEKIFTGYISENNSLICEKVIEEYSFVLSTFICELESNGEYESEINTFICEQTESVSLTDNHLTITPSGTNLVVELEHPTASDMDIEVSWTVAGYPDPRTNSGTINIEDAAPHNTTAYIEAEYLPETYWISKVTLNKGTENEKSVTMIEDTSGGEISDDTYKYIIESNF